MTIDEKHSTTLSHTDRELLIVVVLPFVSSYFLLPFSQKV